MSETTSPSTGSKPATTQQGETRLAGMALALLVVLFIAINALASAWFNSGRLDLTQDRLHTLSSSTNTLLGQVEETVTFRLYLSSGLAQEVPHLGVYANRVRDLLLEYENGSDGKVKLEVLDPIPFSDVEDRAVAAGLQGIPVVTGGDNMYFGLVGTNTTDDVETIPFMQVDREAFIEYDISRMLYALSTPNPTVVGIISGIPIDGTMRITATGQQEPVAPYVVRGQIGQLFETQFLGAQVDDVPEDVNVLLVIHPAKASPRTLFAIDQYLLAGGKAMIFVDPFSEAVGMQGQMLGAVTEGSSLPAMFKAWGVEFDANAVIGDRLSARKVLPEAGNRPVEYLPWLELRGPALDSKSPITSGIDVVAVASAGALKLREGATVTLDPLLTTSPGSSLIPSKEVQGFRNPLKLLRDHPIGNQQYVIAGRLTGSVKTAFPDGLPVIKQDEDEPPAKAPPWTRDILTESAKPLDIVLVGDADLLVDRFWVIMRDFAGRDVPVPTANNGEFVLNAIDALAGSSTLLELRGRGTASRPFIVLQDIQRKAAQQFEDKERELRQTLQKTETSLRALRQRNPSGSAAVISEKDRRSMDRFQRDILKLRSELRTVRRSLNQDFETLEAQLWFLNIALVPILIGLFAILLGIWRGMRRRDQVREAAAG
ncbi:MAG: Gldg family protein [Alphaproteobacteria bacterium]|nr:Gldg family protein [Alphaproteobacteria bacterium]